MSLRVLIVLIVVLMLTAALGCARRQPAPEAVPAVAPPPDTGESGQPADTEATSSDSEGQTLYESKCSRCHTLDRVAEHDPGREPWSKLVKEMQGRKSGWISNEDASVIVQHLEKTYGTR